MQRDSDATQTAGRGEALIPEAGRDELALTLLFHPQSGRIGQQSRLPLSGDAAAVGRHAPLFADHRALPAANASPNTPASRAAPASRNVPATGIGHPRVSRSAFTLHRRDDGWRLERPAASSRLRVEGVAVEGGLTLSDAALRAGVVVLLGQSVLLHLRIEPALDPDLRQRPPAPGFTAVSTAMRALSASLADAAASDDDVLILGPTGTGKDVAARALHDLSHRAGEAFVAVNMGVLTPALAAAELFGARRGAYTGAHSSRRGYFQQADGGTLFLDEIGDTPAEVQPMLLRALQAREVQVVGGGVDQVDVRVIAATELQLDDPRRLFRSALRHRLAARELALLPLAQRREDIGLLVAEALDSAAAEGFRVDCLEEPEAQRWAQCFELLALYPWPGNVRELQQAVAQIAAASRTTLTVPPALCERLLAGRELGASSCAALQPAVAEPAGKKPLQALSDEEFIASWRAVGFEVAAMAREHGASRPAVYRRLESIAECRLARDVPLNELLQELRACRGDLAATARRLEVSRRGLENRLRENPAQGSLFERRAMEGAGSDDRGDEGAPPRS